MSKEQKTPRTHVFAVAVEQYQDTTITPVDYAENDAREFMAAWQALGVDARDCVILLNDQATVAAIRSCFGRLLKGVRSGDNVIVFYAGHGVAFNDVNYITAHDVQRSDIQARSIPLDEVLQQLRECSSNHALLFFDSCHSGSPITPKMRSIYSRFSPEELKQFCSDSDFLAAFASCGVDEFSFPSVVLKHGIWSYCIIQALQGEARQAIGKGSVVTATSLQSFVSNEVPRLLRAAITGTNFQTPCVFRNFTKEFVVADLSQLLAEKAAKSSKLDGVLKDTALVGKDVGSIRKLQGFKKGSHREPDRHSDAAEDFIRSIGGDHVKTQADTIYQQIRDGFGYRRRDINYSFDDGAATIKTPDFDVNVTIAQDSDDPSCYVLITEVGVFRRPAVVTESEFLNIFTPHCNTAVIEFSRKIDIKEKIDDIEDVPELSKYLEYAPDGSWLTLELPNPNIMIRVAEDRMTLKLAGNTNLKTLLTNAQAAFTTLNGSGVVLLL